MDFTTTPPSNSLLPIEASPISSIPCSTKLPIKRKTLTPPKLELSTTQNDTPFKFHRIWTDPDEIRLLQGLLDCSLQGYSFPRDLGIFYNQYSNGMSQPYSKSQLSEKLRRLRKKFRIISARINKGLDRSQLSPQDRALFDLSDQLWGAGKANLSVRGKANLPVSGNGLNCKDGSKRKANAVGVSPNLPNLPSTSTAVLALPVIKKTENGDNGGKSDKVDGESGGFKDELNGKCGVSGEVEGDVNVELVANVKKRSLGDELRSGIVRFATTTLGDVLDQSLKEMRMMVDVKRCSEMEKEVGFEKRWRDQRIAEFDVLAKRLKLVLERSSMVSK